MAPTIEILHINPGSDGDGRKWPKHHFTRNDDYFKERIATDKWIKDLPGGPQPNVVYRLDKLPNGYAGFEKARPDGKHIDRFIYGHPNAQFRSMNEFYPHFKHLMDHGGSAGCTCIQCKAGSKKNGKKPATTGAISTSNEESERSTTPPKRSQYFAGQKQTAQGSEAPPPNLISPFIAKTTGRPRKNGLLESDSPEPQKRKLVDFEGTPDVYESMLAKLKAADPEDVIDLQIEERMSPDWRTSNAMTKNLFKEWQKMPRYVPRTGEVVLFIRKLSDEDTIAWDKSSQSFRLTTPESKKWLGLPNWEAGVVTQMPQEAVLERDLVTDEDKEQGVNYSGFRIEPLSEPGNERKPYTKQHKHIPLHVIRPFVYLRECLHETLDDDCHPSILYALTVSSSFCVVERYRFRGVWPNATVFSCGVYIGSELIIVGDTVRLMPRESDQRNDEATDIMVVTAIRLRFVNLDLEDDDLSVDQNMPYQTCLHFSGRVYTLDPARSFDGVGKVPIDPESNILPTGLSKYGQWYHYTDPKQSAARIELPYTRVLGRCFEDTAIDAWYGADLNMMPPPPGSKAAGKMPAIVKTSQSELSRGLEAIVKAREYSQQHDKRITSQDDTTWFWADTRIEQLDLHEVNGRYVGKKDDTRTPEEMRKWRAALKALDGKSGGLEEYRAAKKEREAEKAKTTAPPLSAYGMVAASRQTGTESGSGTEADKFENEDEDEDAMDLDDGPDDGDENDNAIDDDESNEPGKSAAKATDIITLSDSDDEYESATDQLAGELAKNIRPNDPRVR